MDTNPWFFTPSTAKFFFTGIMVLLQTNDTLKATQFSEKNHPSIASFIHFALKNIIPKVEFKYIYLPENPIFEKVGENKVESIKIFE